MQYIGFFISLFVIGFLYLLKKKKVGFGNRVFISMILGIAVGLILKEEALLIEPLGKVFVSFIKMLVVPLVMASIISSITSIEDPAKLKKVGSKTLAWLLLTTAFAAIIGTFVALLLDPGAGIEFAKDPNFKAREIPTLSGILLDMLPTNPISAMAEGKIIPIIIFSILLAIGITVEGARKPEMMQPVKAFFHAFSEAMFRVTKMILKLTPYGVFGLMASVAGKYGVATLLPLGKVILAVYIACALQIIFIHGSLLAFVVKINPVRFFKKIYPAQVVAFTTRSSYGTLPVTIKSLTNSVRISEKIASFVAPMGATMGMNGCGGIYPAIAAIFVARVFHIPMNLSDYFMLVFITTVASIGTAGVPGTASIMSTVVLVTLGLPVEGIALLLGVDTIIDMARTATNVTGASVVSLLVANAENEFDRVAFERELEEDEEEFELSM